jgi:AraC-like DNA-binding protein
MKEYHESDVHWLSHINPQPHVAGGMVSPRGWVEAERVIYDHELVFFTGGAFEVRLENATQVIHSPAFVIVPPGTRHASWTRPGAEGARRWVHFDWTHVGPPPQRLFTYLPKQPLSAEYRTAPPCVPTGLLQGRVINLEHVIALHERLCSLLFQGGTTALRSHAVLLELLMELFLPASPMPMQAPPPNLAEQVRAWLEQEASKPIVKMEPIVDLLRRTGHSYEHVCRAFREYYGIPPHAYILRLRIERAKVMLRASTLSVADVSKAVGFSHHAHFSRVFRRLTGITPSAVRGQQSRE